MGAVAIHPGRHHTLLLSAVSKLESFHARIAVYMGMLLVGPRLILHRRDLHKYVKSRNLIEQNPLTAKPAPGLAVGNRRTEFHCSMIMHVHTFPRATAIELSVECDGAVLLTSGLTHTALRPVAMKTLPCSGSFPEARSGRCLTFWVPWISGLYPMLGLSTILALSLLSLAICCYHPLKG